MAKEPLHRRLFRALLRLFPAEFRGDFGDQMAADFEDQRQEVAARPPAVRRLWLRTTLDLLARAPREHLDVLWRDIVYALRSLRRHKASTAVAVLSLAIGIGLNSAVFSVVHGVLWRELPFPDSDRLVQVAFVGPDGAPREMLTDPMYLDVQQRARGLEAVGAAAFFPVPVTIVEPGEPRSVTCPAMTPNLFEVLGATPVAGRTFTSAEYAQALSDRTGKTPFEAPQPRAIILSHALWLRLFAGEPAAVGSQVRLAGGQQAEVVGVMGPELEALAGTVVGQAGCWTPGEIPPVTSQQDDTYPNLITVGRLARGTSINQVQAGLAILDLSAGRSSDEPAALRAVPLRDVVARRVRTPLTLLFGAVACVLLVTCANVASLLLARASGRRDELTTRVALGATRGRLVRQSLTEGLVISAVGGAVGLLLALWAVPLIVNWAPANVPRLETVGVDWRTFTFAAGAALVVGLCCGLLPALTSHHGSVLQSSTGRATPRTGRLRHGLAVAEIALALVLVVGATLMVQTVRALGVIDLGFNPDGVIAASLPGTPQEQAEAIERVRALPGVIAAGAGVSPLSGSGMGLGGLTVPGDARTFFVGAIPMTPGFLEALGVRLIAGRFFDENDLAGAGPAPIVVNRAAARMFFGERNPIGRSILDGRQDARVVVGVVEDFRAVGLEAEPEPEIYQVSTRTRNRGANGMVIKLNGDPSALVPAVRSVVRSIDPEEPFRVTPVQDYIDRETAPRRFVLRLIGLFSLLGVILAVVGVYGVIAEFVTQRVPEIGIRMAFGATTHNVLRLVLRQGWRLALIGVPLGLAGAAALNGTMRAQVYGVDTLDPATYVLAALCLILATVAACLVPARRAARLDPVAALRAE